MWGGWLVSHLSRMLSPASKQRIEGRKCWTDWNWMTIPKSLSFSGVILRQWDWRRRALPPPRSLHNGSRASLDFDGEQKWGNIHKKCIGCWGHFWGLNVLLICVWQSCGEGQSSGFDWWFRGGRWHCQSGRRVQHALALARQQLTAGGRRRLGQQLGARLLDVCARARRPRQFLHRRRPVFRPERLPGGRSRGRRRHQLHGEQRLGLQRRRAGGGGELFGGRGVRHRFGAGRGGEQFGAVRAEKGSAVVRSSAWDVPGAKWRCLAGSAAAATAEEAPPPSSTRAASTRESLQHWLQLQRVAPRRAFAAAALSQVGAPSPNEELRSAEQRRSWQRQATAFAAHTQTTTTTASSEQQRQQQLRVLRSNTRRSDCDVIWGAIQRAHWSELLRLARLHFRVTDAAPGGLVMMTLAANTTWPDLAL